METVCSRGSGGFNVGGICSAVASMMTLSAGLCNNAYILCEQGVYSYALVNTCLDYRCLWSLETVHFIVNTIRYRMGRCGVDNSNYIRM
jgi:hypothetical protein